MPPDATFTYHWDTHSWPSAAGVWLYHDHSPGDMNNLNLGAISLLVIHNTANPDDVTISDTDVAELPGGSPNGSPIRPGLLGFTAPAAVNHMDIDGLGGELVHVEHRAAAGVGPGPDEVLVGAFDMVGRSWPGAQAA